MPLLDFTKDWSSSDNGSILSGSDLGTIQSDLTTLLNGGLDSTNISSGGINADRLATGASPEVRDADFLAPDAGFVATGFTHVSSSGLNETLAAGRAYVMKTSTDPDRFVQVVKSTTSVVAVDASKDNYIDLDAGGTFHNSSVTSGNPAPSLFADSTRIIKVVTDATSVTSTTDLRNTTFLSVGLPRGYYNQFVIEGNGTGDTVATFIVRSPLVVKDSTNGHQIAITSDITVDPSTTGAAGRDTGALTSSYNYIFAIGDSTGAKTASALVSSSATTPTLPSGYDIYRFIGVTGNYNTTAPVAIENWYQHGERWEIIANQVTAISVTAGTAGGDDASYDCMTGIRAGATNVFRFCEFNAHVITNPSAADAEYRFNFNNGRRASGATGGNRLSIGHNTPTINSPLYHRSNVTTGVSTTGTFRVRTAVITGTFTAVSMDLYLVSGIIDLRA